MPLINLCKISPHAVLGIWKIQESIQEMKEINKNEKININEKINDKKFIESVAARMVIKKLSSFMKLNYYGIHKNNLGKPLLIKSKANISISHSYPYAVGLMNQKNVCGVDIENITKKVLKINSKFLNKNEIIKVGNSLIKNTIYWSCKEALFKAYNKSGISFINDISINETEEKNKIIGKIKNKEFTLLTKKIDDFIIIYTN